MLCDHPRNWLLSTPNLKVLRQLADNVGAMLIVDTSVQPLQRLQTLGLAHLVTISLSKYPSMGETIGGAILGSVQDLAPVRAYAQQWGLVISPEAASTVFRHLPSLVDRMDAVSTKAIAVARFLEHQPGVQMVCLPDLSGVGAACGGQLSCRFVGADLAAAVEEVVGWNSGLGDKFALALACTFGASYTTIEHFGSRIARDGSAVVGSEFIGPGWVRIGIGHEPVEEIIGALGFAINTATRNALAA